uniref:Uncharacterized protein n=1 Tax=Romanomermis culicivorax TaxID=13658 RepID=A0A915KCH7_ROMCU
MAMADEELVSLKIDSIGIFPNKEGIQHQIKVVFVSLEHKKNVVIHAKNLANFNKTRKPPTIFEDDLTRKQHREKWEKFTNPSLNHLIFSPHLFVLLVNVLADGKVIGALANCLLATVDPTLDAFFGDWMAKVDPPLLCFGSVADIHFVAAIFDAGGGLTSFGAGAVVDGLANDVAGKAVVGLSIWPEDSGDGLAAFAGAFAGRVVDVLDVGTDGAALERLNADKRLAANMRVRFSSYWENMVAASSP